MPRVLEQVCVCMCVKQRGVFLGDVIVSGSRTQTRDRLSAERVWSLSRNPRMFWITTLRHAPSQKETHNLMWV